MFNDVWTIVLAAGAGRRLAGLTGGVPKQFWIPAGAPASLLELTIGRLTPIASPSRTVTVIDRAHGQFVKLFDNVSALGAIVSQPVDRGTAAGILLPLLRVLAESPDAIVVVTPSDHAFDDDDRMLRGLLLGIARVRARRSDVVLFGVEATHAAGDLGWVVPAGAPSSRRETFQRVDEFVEKPDRLDALRLFAGGAVWNTMIVVARAQALLFRFQQSLPLLTHVLSEASTAGSAEREALIADWYLALPRADFSRDLLSSSRPLCLYTWASTIGWSDLGTPERVSDWMVRRQRARRLLGRTA